MCFLTVQFPGPRRTILVSKIEIRLKIFFKACFINATEQAHLGNAVRIKSDVCICRPVSIMQLQLSFSFNDCLLNQCLNTNTDNPLSPPSIIAYRQSVLSILQNPHSHMPHEYFAFQIPSPNSVIEPFVHVSPRRWHW